MANDAVLPFDRGAILQRMLTGRIDLAGDAHEGLLPRPEPLPTRAHPRMATGDREGDIATLDAVRATAEHLGCSFLTSCRAERSKPRSKPGMRATSGTYGTRSARRRKQVAAMGNGSPTPAESISLKKLHLSFGVFILAVLGVAIRVVRITDPFIDFWSWRQSDVAMIAENFSRNGFHVFFPQINWAGPTPGYVGTEFQLVPLLAALLYRLFGVHEWIGRAVSVAFFAASLPVFFLVVRRLYTARAALAAVSVYIAVPLSIFSSRSFMPDMASLSMALVALYLFTRWLEHDRHPLVFTGVAVTLALALLVKPFIATVGFALLYLAIGKYGRGWLRATWLWTLATLAVLPSLVWYAHAYYVSISNPPYHFFGSGGVGFGSLKDYAGIAEEVVFVSLTPTVAVLASIGLFVRPRRPGGHVFHYWLIGVPLLLAQHSSASPMYWHTRGDGARRSVPDSSSTSAWGSPPICRSRRSISRWRFRLSGPAWRCVSLRRATLWSPSSMRATRRRSTTVDGRAGTFRATLAAPSHKTPRPFGSSRRCGARGQDIWCSSGTPCGGSTSTLSLAGR